MTLMNTHKISFDAKIILTFKALSEIVSVTF